MSYRPQIKTDANGTTSDFPLDAATLNGKSDIDFIKSSSLANYTTSAISDPNLATVNGFYYVNGSTNRPPFSQSSAIDYRVLTTAYSAQWLQQIATDFRCRDVFVRRCQQGTWQQWYRLSFADEIPTVPTKVSELQNDSGFITKVVSDLTNYYTKSETYTKTEVQSLIGTVSNMSFEVVSSLPTSNISTTKIYLVSKDTSGTNDIYDEYIYVNSKWEKIGSTAMSLDRYLPLTGGTLTGNLTVGNSSIGTNGYLQGSWLKATALAGITTNTMTPGGNNTIVVADNTGWLYHCTLASLYTALDIDNKISAAITTTINASY